jgi:PAS domain S-box-containing protein
LELERLRELVERDPAQLLGTGLLAVDQKGCIVVANGQAEQMFGFESREMPGRQIEELIPQRLRSNHKSLREGFLARPSRRLMGAGRDLFGLRRDGREFPLEIGLVPLGTTEKLEYVLVSVVDITERKKREAQEQLLVRELAHRVNNTLAVIQAIIAQTLRRKGDDPAAFAEAVAGRIDSLGKAHQLLFQARWSGADLKTLAKEQLAALLPQPEERITIEGPELLLPPLHAAQLALVLHELGTNAVKHGALANDQGRISLTWDLHSMDDGNRLLLRWTERGGPPVSGEPGRKGLGSTLIKAGIAGGKTNWRFDPKGVVYELDFPVNVLTADLP